MSIHTNLSANITEDVRQHGDVVRAHDAVHPDRSVCGGVGGCAVMRAELDTERAVIDAIENAIRHGYTLTVEVSK